MYCKGILNEECCVRNTIFNYHNDKSSYKDPALPFERAKNISDPVYSVRIENPHVFAGSSRSAFGRVHRIGSSRWNYNNSRTHNFCENHIQLNVHNKCILYKQLFVDESSWPELLVNQF